MPLTLVPGVCLNFAIATVKETAHAKQTGEAHKWRCNRWRAKPTCAGRCCRPPLETWQPAGACLPCTASLSADALLPLQARDVDVGSGGCSKRHSPASPAGGHLPASPVSALSVIASPYAQTGAQEACARDGSEGSSQRESDGASPFALAEVADACAAVGLRPRQRSRSLLSDRMAEQEVRPWHVP